MTPDQLNALFEYIDSKCKAVEARNSSDGGAAEDSIAENDKFDVIVAFGFAQDRNGYAIEGPRCSCCGRELPCAVCGQP